MAANIRTFTLPESPDTFFGRSVEDVLAPGFFNTLHTTIHIDETEYHMEIAVPGISRRDVSINLDGHVLCIVADRKARKVLQDRTEIDTRHFRRSFILPEDADLGSISATCRHGMLTIRMNRKRSLARQIEIKESNGNISSIWARIKSFTGFNRE